LILRPQFFKTSRPRSPWPRPGPRPQNMVLRPLLRTTSLVNCGCYETRIVDKSKLSVIFPILTYGHESWVMIERLRSQVQASEMGFLRRIEGVTLFDKVRSFEIRKPLKAECFRKVFPNKLYLRK